MHRAGLRHFYAIDNMCTLRHILIEDASLPPYVHFGCKKTNHIHLGALQTCFAAPLAKFVAGSPKAGRHGRGFECNRAGCDLVRNLGVFEAGGRHQVGFRAPRLWRVPVSAFRIAAFMKAHARERGASASRCSRACTLAAACPATWEAHLASRSQRSVLSSTAGWMRGQSTTLGCALCLSRGCVYHLQRRRASACRGHRARSAAPACTAV